MTFYSTGRDAFVETAARVTTLAVLAACLATTAGCGVDDGSADATDVGVTSDSDADASETDPSDAADADTDTDTDADAADRDTLDWREPPVHRATPASCPAPEAEGSALACEPMQEDNGGGTCSVSADCGDGSVCLDTHGFGGDSSCQCHATGCTSDDDCDTGEICQCGSLDPTASTCGGWTGVQCANQCLPAQCRVDSDCGPGGYCSPSKNHCGWQIEGWYCRDRAVDECITDDDCDPDRTRNEFCRRDPDGDRWRCELRPNCD